MIVGKRLNKAIEWLQLQLGYFQAATSKNEHIHLQPRMEDEVREDGDRRNSMETIRYINMDNADYLS